MSKEQEELTKVDVKNLVTFFEECKDEILSCNKES